MEVTLKYQLAKQEVSGVSVKWGDVNLTTVKKGHNTYFTRGKTSERSYDVSGAFGYILQQNGKDVNHPKAVNDFIKKYSNA